MGRFLLTVAAFLVLVTAGNQEQRVRASLLSKNHENSASFSKSLYGALERKRCHKRFVEQVHIFEGDIRDTYFGAIPAALVTSSLCCVAWNSKSGLLTALKCYVCSGTEDDCKKSTLEGDKDKYLIECGKDYDKCLRAFLKKDSATLVENTCSNQLGCNQNIIKCGQYNGVTCKVSCCDEDECNVGSHVSFNVFLLTVCFALGLALLM